MICVAMGYPEEDVPANAVVSGRRPVDQVASFVGFVGFEGVPHAASASGG